MAKIYETQEDVERDRLKENARDTEARADFIGVQGSSLGFMGAWLLSWKELNEKSFKFSNVLGIGSIIAGVLAVGTSFVMRHSASKTKKQLAALGPEKVVLPCCDVLPNGKKAAETANAISTDDKGKHVARLESEAPAAAGLNK